MIMMVVCYSFLLANCGGHQYWWCYVDAIGEHPIERTYFVEGRFPQELNPLITKEYIKELDITMSHLGYTKVDSADATLKIAFGYVLGEVEERAYSYSTPVLQYNPPRTTSTNTTITNNQGKTIANVNSTTSTPENKYGTISYAGERSKTSYITEQSITLMIDAFEIKTEEPIWSVRASDKINPIDIQNLRKYMPLYLLNMYPYIGNNSESRQKTKVYLDDKRLQWFQSQTQHK